MESDPDTTNDEVKDWEQEEAEEDESVVPPDEN